jgi:murein DD-endopeptidase MepM/ murein hydrolase activator NlpD
VNTIKKLFKIFLLIILIVPMMIPPQEVKGKTINGLQQEINDAKKQIEENKNKKQLTQEQIQTVNANISLIDKEIKDGEAKVIALNEESIKLANKIEEKKEEIKKIINFFQLSNGEETYLEYVFGAATFTDFIYRKAITEQLTKYNKNLVKEFDEMIKANRKKTEEIAEQEKELLKKQANLQSEIVKLRYQTNLLEKDTGDLEDGILEAQKTLNDLRRLGCGENEEARACYDRLNTLPVDTQFWRPTNTGVITSYFGPRTYPYVGFHYGIDIGIPIGTPVYAIAAGKVASFNYWDGTGYVVYVYHNINGVKYTSVYEHLDRYNTYVGAIVDKNTVIAFSGNTGNSTGPHLHLSILNGWAGIDYILWSNSYFNNNLNPITKINFPSGQYWNNRTTWYK